MSQNSRDEQEIRLIAMPELPDVEVFRQYVDATSLHQRVDHLHVRDEALLRDVSRQKLVSALVGTEIGGRSTHWCPECQS